MQWTFPKDAVARDFDHAGEVGLEHLRRADLEPQQRVCTFDRVAKRAAELELELVGAFPIFRILRTRWNQNTRRTEAELIDVRKDLTVRVDPGRPPVQEHH